MPERQPLHPRATSVVARASLLGLISQGAKLIEREDARMVPVRTEREVDAVAADQPRFGDRRRHNQPDSSLLSLSCAVRTGTGVSELTSGERLTRSAGPVNDDTGAILDLDSFRRLHGPQR